MTLWKKKIVSIQHSIHLNTYQDLCEKPNNKNHILFNKKKKKQHAACSMQSTSTLLYTLFMHQYTILYYIFLTQCIPYKNTYQLQHHSLNQLPEKRVQHFHKTLYSENCYFMQNCMST